ncbi:MAG: DUF4382 domain-containing protein [Gammaproteobacteria bacterium]|nr:DUF4382 domain-containing protein [Gammaproteobacteria bacterium]
MKTPIIFAFARLSLLAGFLSIAACGGGGPTAEAPAEIPPAATAGTVGLLFTDKPSDEFSAIRLNVVEAILIGGDEGQQMLFQGSELIDLLNLTNFNEPVIFGEVKSGTYSKLRLVIDDLELVPADGGPSIYPSLPANGKIDLLDQDGFAVLPERTLLIEIDMDANKSIKITGAGNGRKYNFRPVVKVDIMDGGEQGKLARVEGIVKEIFTDPAGSFLLCDIETPDSCMDVTTDMNSSIFDDMGLPTDFTTLMVNDPVVVIGSYNVDSGVVLEAQILEIGGSAEQVKGNVVSNPTDNEFLLFTDDDMDLVVELQTGTKYFDVNGAIGADAIVIGTDVEIEGVKPAKADPADPDFIRAALVFVEADDDEQISGTIIEPLDAVARSFGLTLTEGGDTCVRVNPDADIVFVDEAASEVTMGSIDDLAVGQTVDLFGMTAADECFDANEVIVEVIPEST